MVEFITGLQENVQARRKGFNFMPNFAVKGDFQPAPAVLLFH